MYIAEGTKPHPECINYDKSLQSAMRSYAESVDPTARDYCGDARLHVPAAERPSTRGIGTVPPNTFENGVGAGATALTVSIPMPALRQQ